MWPSQTTEAIGGVMKQDVYGSQCLEGYYCSPGPVSDYPFVRLSTLLLAPDYQQCSPAQVTSLAAVAAAA